MQQLPLPLPLAPLLLCQLPLVVVLLLLLTHFQSTLGDAGFRWTKLVA
jgi:hypothetical protein